MKEAFRYTDMEEAQPVREGRFVNKRSTGACSRSKKVQKSLRLGLRAGGIVTGNDTARALKCSNAEKWTWRPAPEYVGVRGGILKLGVQRISLK